MRALTNLRAPLVDIQYPCVLGPRFEIECSYSHHGVD